MSRRLIELIRSHLTLSRAQALMGIVAAVLSIGGSLYAYLYQQTKAVPTSGEILAIVQEARSGSPVADASIEVLTGKDAVVTTLVSKAEGRVQGSFPEGTYRLRVTHPRFAGETTRHVYVIAGRTAEVRLRLATRAAGRSAGAPPAGGGAPSGTGGSPSPVDEVERGVKKGVDTLRRIFQ